MSSTSSSGSELNLATVKMVLSAATSVAAAAMVARSVANDYLPDELRYHVSYYFHRFFGYFSSQMTIVIDESRGYVPNEVFKAAETYLATKISPSTRRINVSKEDKDKNFNVTVDRDEEVTDTFNGVKLRWILVCRQVETNGSRNSTQRLEERSFELSFHKKFKNLVLESYLPFLVKQAVSMRQKAKTLKLFTLDPDNMYGNYSEAWISVTLDHPSTFQTLALDPEFKRSIMEDIDRFVERKDFYRKVGKAWKRGYLLYGPPGTGKSSLIAAMANYLNFDIYDLDLTAVRTNSELRRLLIATANRSILVVEDIDCTIDLKDRTATEPPPNSQENDDPPQSKVTLSGLLNFVDGLWSSCGDERIIIFTTNYKEKLDSALLRPGRMDMHINMSYCTASGFKVLASNYLDIEEHRLFSEIEDAINAAEVSPADVAECLLRNDSIDEVLEGLLEFLKSKKIHEEDEVKAKIIKDQ
ncbi:PREDICTED: protein HYPER-SENSITIVITY-RELATED 4 [Tarenaya hassleriana]|uniref:protein HYPER-SENSITIVITY-RELATED 4 n=1 Tax=Tarenaya hassleriana TaxID=28532 RepID=UPI00053C4037|nr:PREDICTED: protein HYPER-SENSITIVITY-RELATED 4 [Tarenaya hassleriana]